MMRTVAVAILLLLRAPAFAEEPAPIEAWKIVGDRALVVPAQISLPAHVGALSLTNTSELSQKGKGVDDVARYRSDDGKVTASVFVFYPVYADAALSLYANDRSIRANYGPEITMTSERLEAVGGIPNAAIRRDYEKAVIRDSDPFVTTLGIVRADSWMIVLRIDGPVDQPARVEAAFDALLGGVRFEGSNKPMVAQPLKIAPTCPAGTIKSAKYLGNAASNKNGFAATMFGGKMIIKKEGQPDADPPLAFPRNGAVPLCIRGTVGTGKDTHEILSPVNPADGDIALVVLDDSNTIITVERMFVGTAFVVKRYGIGTIDVYGSFDAMLSNAQLNAVYSGKDISGSRRRGHAVIGTDGNTTIEVDPDTLK